MGFLAALALATRRSAFKEETAGSTVMAFCRVSHFVVGVVEPQRHLLDGEVAAVERLGLGVAALGAVQLGQVVERGTERRFVSPIYQIRMSRPFLTGFNFRGGLRRLGALPSTLRRARRVEAFSRQATTYSYFKACVSTWVGGAAILIFWSFPVIFRQRV
jgi:hypothetical protein